MTAMLATTVPGWLWQATTIVAAVTTVALIAILTAHVILSAIVSESERRDPRSLALHRLAVAAVPLIVCLAGSVAMRFAIILIERPGR
jgi:hypothetical protein